MVKKPDFDLKKVVNEEYFKKCEEFIPKFKESTEKVEYELKEGKLDLLDSNLELYDENELNEVKFKEEDNEENEESIVLDVGMGVFDVKGKTPSEKVLKEAGVSVVDVKEDLKVKKNEPLIVEVSSKRNENKG